MKTSVVLGLALAAAVAAPALAHAPILDCFDNGDDTITCEAGYSDGSSAAGQTIRVRDIDHKLVFEAEFDEDGSYTFDRPDSPEFHIEFIGDDAHAATVYSTDIETE